MSEGIALTTPAQIALYRLLSLRGALRLEIAGMKHSRGFSACATLKAEYGITGSRKEQLVKLEKRIQELTE